jgi:hypothetical protein
MDISTLSNNFKFALGDSVKISTSEKDNSVEFCFYFKGFKFCQKHALADRTEAEMIHQVYVSFIYNYTQVVQELVDQMMEVLEHDAF